MPAEPSSTNCSDGIGPDPGPPTGPTEAAIAELVVSRGPRRHGDAEAAQWFALMRTRAHSRGLPRQGSCQIVVRDERTPHRAIRGNGDVPEWAAWGCPPAWPAGRLQGQRIMSLKPPGSVRSYAVQAPGPCGEISSPRAPLL